ncbi:hypothetical protein PsorP6_001068 [Peronosclerospora sorghi]|uniref:Uncharacterized protein n=1 Tax=Peronosclerospora sorghi TaxID=230839 RepID=A0ACC0WUD1_9STRA|nr:hypothetical protein PsorP6_001068 [Peronosclerospora sorghi]
MTDTSSDVSPAVPDTWRVSQIPSQIDKVVVVTGANSGLGYETALQLALRGAHVVLACRNEKKGLEAESKLRETLNHESGSGSVEFLPLDLSDLKSVGHFVTLFKRRHNRLDILVNNAGVMGGSYTLTVDGYERMFATNHLGHFALTAQLFDLIKKSDHSRVVNVSSGLHKKWAASFNEKKIMVSSEERFGQVQTYGETKLCNLLFTLEMDSRLRTAGLDHVTVVACHPGYVKTNLGSNMAAANTNWIYWLLIKLVTLLPGGKSPEVGAMPILYAATGDEVVGGDYIGPKDRHSGAPARHEPAIQCTSESARSNLWAYREKLANVTFTLEKTSD